MRRALALARQGWGQTAPNPMVGAVVVRDGRVAGEGAHLVFGGPHAEVVALAAAGELARGATLYVTLEPCNHQGKTGPCTKAIVAAGIARVVAAVADPHPIAAGGADFLRANGVNVEMGLEAEAAGELIAPFLFSVTSSRPFVTLKLALSREGAVADRARSKKWLSTDESRDEVHRLRANVDAIAVGAGTVITDNPELAVRGRIIPRRAPTRVVFDRSAKIPLDSKLVRTARSVPTVIVTRPGTGTIPALHAAGATVIESTDTLSALEKLRSSGVQHLFVEGGAGLARDLLGAGLVDRLIIFQTRVPLGEGGIKPFERIEDLNVRRIVERARFGKGDGKDDMTIYELGSK